MRRKETLKKTKSVYIKTGLASSACFGAAIGAAYALNPLYSTLPATAYALVITFYVNSLRRLERQTENLKLEEELTNYQST